MKTKDAAFLAGHEREIYNMHMAICRAKRAVYKQGEETRTIFSDPIFFIFVYFQSSFQSLFDNFTKMPRMYREEQMRHIEMRRMERNLVVDEVEAMEQRQILVFLSTF